MAFDAYQRRNYLWSSANSVLRRIIKACRECWRPTFHRTISVHKTVHRNWPRFVSLRLFWPLSRENEWSKQTLPKHAWDGCQHNMPSAPGSFDISGTRPATWCSNRNGFPLWKECQPSFWNWSCLCPNPERYRCNLSAALSCCHSAWARAMRTKLWEQWIIRKSFRDISPNRMLCRRIHGWKSRTMIKRFFKQMQTKQQR